jgi:hypothetical protein
VTRALALLAALALAACAGPNHVTRGGMEQIARDWQEPTQPYRGEP